jgi:hypothetical protein
MMDLDLLAIRATAAYTQVHRAAFTRDPSANPRLSVEVVEAVRVQDTPTLVLVTPWSLFGLVFPAGPGFPARLTIAGEERPLFPIDLPPLEPCRSVTLVGQVWDLRDQRRARRLARSWGVPFRAAVRAALDAGAPRPGEAPSVPA